MGRDLIAQAARALELDSVGELLAVSCDCFPDENHTMCRWGDGRYQGWHCPRCRKSTSCQGHRKCAEDAGGEVTS